GSDATGVPPAAPTPFGDDGESGVVPEVTGGLPQPTAAARAKSTHVEKRLRMAAHSAKGGPPAARPEGGGFQGAAVASSLQRVAAVPHCVPRDRDEGHRPAAPPP